MLDIKHIDEFRSHVAHKEEMREMDIGEGCTSFCYMIAAEGTFDDAWSRECRGIVFDNKTGAVIGRPLHKFFNVNERESTRVENLDWSKVTRVMDKRDGSMIHTVITEQGIRLKSKKTFTSEVALAAEEWMHAQENKNVLRLAHHLASLDCTAIFEWTAPDARIVLHYPEPELQLLHVRDNMTGEYHTFEDVFYLGVRFNVKVVDPVNDFWNDGKLDIAKMLDTAQTIEGIEGWVIQFENGEMVKLKTQWYLKRHRAMTFLRERDIAQLVLDEGLDDLKAMLVGEGVNIDEVLQIEARVLHDLREMALNVDVIFAADGHLDRKDFAIKHKGSPHFGLLMARYQGRDPAFKEFFERNMLREQYSLRQLVLVPSVAEGD